MVDIREPHTRLTLVVYGVALVALLWVFLSPSGPLDEPEIAPGRAPAWSAEPNTVGSPKFAQATGDTLVVVGEYGVAALARSTGKIRWQRDVTGDVVVTGEAVVVRSDWGDGSDIVEVLDLATGRTRYEVREDGDTPVRKTSVARDVLLVLRCDDADACELSGLSLRDGRPRWSRETAEHDTVLPEMPWTNEPPLDQTPLGLMPRREATVAVIGEVSRENGDRRTALTTIDARTGASVGRWSGAARPVHGSLVGDLLLDADDGGTTAFDPHSRREVWTTAARLSSVRHAGAFLVDTDGRRVADVSTGETAWTAPISATFVGVDGGLAIYYGANRSGAAARLTATSLASARTAWRVSPPGSRRSLGDVEGKAGAAGGWVAFDSAQDGSAVMQVLRAKDGGQAWHARDTALLSMGDGWIVGVEQDSAYGGSDLSPRLRYFAR